jgi:hypothetical protein
MQSPLPHPIPLKVCAMLALANILSKSFLAFVYIGMFSDLKLSKTLEQTTDRSRRTRTIVSAKS